MRNPPIEVILSWPKPNYVDPPTRGNSVMILSIVLLILVTVVVAARVWARFVIVRLPGADDWLIIVAWFLTTGLTCCVLLSVYRYSWNRHIWDVPLEHIVASRKASWAGQVLIILSQTFVKISILLFYKRVVRGTYNTAFLTVVWVTISSIVCICIGFEGFLLFSCHPLEAYWMQYSPMYNKKFHCADESWALLMAVVLSVVTDVLVASLPAFVVWRMQLPKRQKLSLYGIFGLGFIVVVAGVFRCYYMHLVVFTTYDVTWDGYNVWNVTAIEHNLAIICASAPALKPFLSRYLSSGNTSSRKTSGVNGSLNPGRGTDVRTFGSGGIRRSAGDREGREKDIELNTMEREVGWFTAGGDPSESHDEEAATDTSSERSSKELSKDRAVAERTSG